MHRYADTCLLLSLLFRDSGTDAALKWLEAAGSAQIVISTWSQTEFASAAGILARRGDLSAELHREGLARFQRFAMLRLTVEMVSTSDFERARIWLEDFRTGLRAGDALHLALCARLGTLLCTADDTLATAADRYGIPVSRVTLGSRNVMS